MAGDFEVVGREDDLRQLRRFIDHIGRLPSAFLLEGEAGIGKTTLWLEGVRCATARGYQTLSARPSETETRMSFSAVNDLLKPVLPEMLDHLAPVQARALRVALLLEEPETVAPRLAAVAFAFSNGLSALASERPVLLAIDDVQWLDPESLAVLEFAIRRLEGHRVGLIVSRRTGADSPVPLGLDRSLPAERITRLELGGLSLGALMVVIQRRLGLPLRRPTLMRIHEVSAGNPMYALELARLMEITGRIDEPLLLPSTLQEAARKRLAALPASTRDALAVAAVLSEPTLALLVDCVGTSTEAALQPALDSHVVSLEGNVIRFTHPVLRSAAFVEAAPSRRRQIHVWAAGSAPTIEERGRHLARISTKPDDEVAAILQEAAEEAARRGAPGAAAELAEDAWRLTPEPNRSKSIGRAMLAGQSFWAAGDYDRGRRFLEAAAAWASGVERARALWTLARNPRNMRESLELCMQARRDAAGEAGLGTEITIFMAKLAYGGGDLHASLRLAGEAVDLAQRGADQDAEIMARGAVAFFTGLAGRRFSLEDMTRAAELEASRSSRPIFDGAAYCYALTLSRIDDLDGARHQFERIIASARQAGDWAYADMLSELGLLAFREGDWTLAEGLIDQAIELAQQFGLQPMEAEAKSRLGLIAAARGDVEAARAVAEPGMAASRSAAEPLGEIRHRFVLGLAAVSVQDWTEAAEQLGRALHVMQGVGLRDALIPPYTVEALVGAGRLEAAEKVAQDIWELATNLARPRWWVYAHRSVALTAGARGNLPQALASLEQALTAHDGLRDPFELAHTLLLTGQVQRRAKQRREARNSLTRALASFDELGARAWSDRTQAELARIGGRRAVPDQLTTAERRIAELVAKGKTNREVAGALFISIHTVEAALTRVYSKLGVRSRAGLARAVDSKM